MLLIILVAMKEIMLLTVELEKPFRQAELLCSHDVNHPGDDINIDFYHYHHNNK